METRTKIIGSVILIGAGIGVMYVISGLPGALIGSLFLIGALFLWTLPPPAAERGSGRQDPMQRRVSGTLLGIGLGMIGGLAAAIFIPPPWLWLVLGAILLTAMVWWFRQ
ncbi:MAG: hypothetical protein R3C44_18405 [Chloroflexota bacterium]